jgi:hypothetical protein
MTITLQLSNYTIECPFNIEGTDAHVRVPNLAIDVTDILSEQQTRDLCDKIRKTVGVEAKRVIFEQREGELIHSGMADVQHSDRLFNALLEDRRKELPTPEQTTTKPSRFKSAVESFLKWLMGH